MQVVVKRSALISALGNIIGENRTGESGSISDIMRDAMEGEEPIKPTEQMATQLSVDMPDVSDSDFVPVNIEELSRSAYVIADAVPPGEIDWFYRKLHELLDDALDRDSDVSQEEEEVEVEEIEEETEETEEEVSESVIKKILSLLMEQPVNYDDDDYRDYPETPEETKILDADLERHPESTTPSLVVAGAVLEFVREKKQDMLRARMSRYTEPADIVQDYPYIFFDEKDSKYFGSFPGTEVPVMVLKVIENISYIKKIYDEEFLKSNKESDAFKKAIISDYRILDSGVSGKSMKTNAQDIATLSSNLIFDFIVKAVKAIDPSLPLVEKGKEYMKILRPAPGEKRPRIAQSLADIMIKYSSGGFQDVDSEMNSIASGVSSQKTIPISLPGMKGKAFDVPGDILSATLLSTLQSRSQQQVTSQQPSGPLYGDDEPAEDVDTSGIEELLDIDPEVAAAKLKTLSALAPIFGKASASGFRQEAMKFPWAIFDVVGGGEARRELSLAEYSDSVFKNFRRLAEEASELIAVYSLPVEDAYDIDFEKAQEEGRDVDPLIQKDFDLIQKLDGQLNDLKTSEDSRGGVDPQMILSTVAGHILRRIFRENFYHTTFVDYAREMKKHMTKWLAGEGLSPGAVRYFSKMFNGEVVLESYNSKKKKMKDAIAGGLTKDIYDRAIKEKIKFHKLFFNKENIERNTERFEKFIKDQSKLAAAFTEAGEKGGEWLKAEIEYPQLKIDDPSFIVESEFKKIISRMV